MDWEIIKLVIGLSIVVLVVIISIVHSFKDDINEAKKRRIKEKNAEKYTHEKEEAERKKLEKKLEEKHYINQFTEKYKNNLYVEKLAKVFVNRFINSIACADRDLRKQDIFVGVSLKASYRYRPKEGIYPPKIDYFDFEKENLKPIDNQFQLFGFMEAVALSAEKIFQEEYTTITPKDISGMPYTVEMHKSHRCSTSHSDQWDGIYEITFSYRASNGYYEAPKEWI